MKALAQAAQSFGSTRKGPKEKKKNGKISLPLCEVSQFSKALPLNTDNVIEIVVGASLPSLILYTPSRTQGSLPIGQKFDPRKPWLSVSCASCTVFTPKVSFILLC